MSAVKSFRRDVFKGEIPRRLFAWLILFCISLCSLSAFGQKNIESSDLVFCPLQKTWVKRNPAPMPPIKVGKPLGEICSSDRQKEIFFFELSKNLNFRQTISNRKNEEKLFFNYLEKGKQAFAEIAPSQNFPDRQFAKLASTEKSISSNYKNDFCRTSTEVFALYQFPRPPTVQNSAFFKRTDFHKLGSIWRKIQPRAPPSVLL